ncbi:SRPBCC domain-containing protein [Mucilaginibacter lacusdianchii]|uniref:SRPBCC domain-containing protein n=1 Tax=Mucilaginibacter lacusdianchii TaxID=2684211 RepID=UPI001E5A3903|nr:SRPBCC domain-containing protein [Mucilaginibacter sp. JXJ CY 39]
MAAKDGSFSFDFEGTYTKVEPNRLLEYILGDGRKVNVLFEATGNTTKVVETFDPESTHPREMQQGGWQAILNNYKKQAEA